MEWLQQVLLCLAGFALCQAERLRLEGHQVYQLQPETTEQLTALQTLESQPRETFFLDPLHLGKLDVIVAPNFREKFLPLLEQLKLSYLLVDDNPQASLEMNIEPVADLNRRNAEYSWTEYHELNDTYDWLHSLANKYPNIASVFVAGQSYEGRELLGLRIAHNASAERAIFLEAGMHAREWIGPATATYFANELLNSEQPLAKSFIWYILPHANPDGYVYTHTTNRLWRKTRSPAPSNSDCAGTDPNRNWDFHWREVGASADPCSEAYAGASAFSERETQTLSQFLRELPEPIFMYMAVHSFSQLLLYPYGHTAELPENHEQVKHIFKAAVSAMKRRYGTRYTGGNVYDAIYPAAGSSMDWAYGALGAKYAFTYELRPSGYSFWTGFRLPASQIIPTGQETTDSIIELIQTAMSMK